MLTWDQTLGSVLLNNLPRTNTQQCRCGCAHVACLGKYLLASLLLDNAVASAAHAENLSIAAAQAFKTEEVKLHKMKKVLANLTDTT